ncbi:hypothetical protein HYPSUDRAFT_370805 [Hypholoma sublateritium FD-334 SS-4]|uniref:Ubiquitin 3 binding protein But2 C-terminal domain-containing protein n=1 Tax=Hypholoma sublateritium (strain FD-334 SS-4) TaxID=945553 RepID=A0A0D2P4J0_HYPSF|nr:hypothetical protein HYPSUDRAFT_370805 [Hypholoma sublateritium FD-334 SS-4]
MVRAAKFCLSVLPGLFFSLNLVSLVGADVVIYRPVPVTNPTPAITEIVSASVVGITAISVQSNGATLYAETDVESGATLVVGGVTNVVLSTPTTYSFTFAEGASLFSESGALTTAHDSDMFSVGQQQICTGTGITGGVVGCVEVEAASIGGQTPTSATFSYSATMSPIFTIKSSSTRVTCSVPVVFFSISALAYSILQSV